MPLLDVSDVLDDPLFADTITVTRNVETIDSHGRAVVTPQTFADVSAVVTAGQGDVMKLFPELANIMGTILVHTKFNLVSTSETTQADHILFKGREYVVSGLNDWSSYGVGFMIAGCTMKNLLEAAP